VKKKAKILFEDDNILAVDKPAFLNASDVEYEFKDAILLNRLDKETSGVMLLVKNEEFRKKAIKEYKHNKVYKEYIAIVEGKVVESITIDTPISTIKGKSARSRVDEKYGKPALTTIYPYLVEGNKSKIKIVIENGRTHQIRVHLESVGLPIIGDLQYGKPSTQTQRMLLHSLKTKIFNYEFEAPEPKEFFHFGFDDRSL
jgi:23S rRNA pseudouridine1911/1915/1917 synthase